MRLFGQLTVKTRSNLSIGHLRNAAYLAGTCSPFEEEYEWPATEAVLVAHASLSSSAIILSACAIEAGANELHLCAVDATEPQLGRLLPAAGRIAELWDTVERGPVLRKYQWFLSMGGLERFAEGEQPYQGVADLFELRDALVHWKPEWSNDAKYSQRLEKRMAGKFPLNRLSMPDQLFIPYRMSGYGAACWAVRTATKFLLEFGERIGANSDVVKFEGELKGALGG